MCVAIYFTTCKPPRVRVQVITLLESLLVLVRRACETHGEGEGGVIVAAILRRDGEHLRDRSDALRDLGNVPSGGRVGFLDQVRGREARDEFGDIVQPVGVVREL